MEYKKMLRVMEAVKDYGTGNIADCEIVYINETKNLKVNYTDKESLFIEL